MRHCCLISAVFVGFLCLLVGVDCFCVCLLFGYLVSFGNVNFGCFCVQVVAVLFFVGLIVSVFGF